MPFIKKTSSASRAQRLELWNLHEFAVFENGLMRDHAAHRRVERRRDVDERVFVLEDGLDEVVHEMTVRTAVTARIDGLRERLR